MKSTLEARNYKPEDQSIIPHSSQGVINPQATFPRTSEVGILSMQAAASLFQRPCESLPLEEIIAYIFLKYDLKLILLLRLISKGCCFLTSNINQYFPLCSLLSQKSIISLDYAQIYPKIDSKITEKYNFAINHTGINILISFGDLNHRSSDLAEKLNSCLHNAPRITLLFLFSNSSEFEHLQDLYKNNKLSKNQQLIFSHTNEINLCVSLTDFMNRADNLIAQLEIFPKKRFNFDFSIENSNTLAQLSILLSEAQCSENQKYILNNTKSLYISDEIEIENDTIAPINQLLSLLALQLKSLKFYALFNTPFELSNCSLLEDLEFGYVNSDLTVKNLLMLKNLEFDHISYCNVTLTLENLPELTKLSFQNLGTKVNFPIFSKLKELSFLCIKEDQSLPIFPNLESISLGTIDKRITVTLPPCPKLISISFDKIKKDGTLILPSPAYLDLIENRNQVLELYEVTTNDDGTVSISLA